MHSLFKRRRVDNSFSTWVAMCHPPPPCLAGNKLSKMAAVWHVVQPCPTMCAWQPHYESHHPHKVHTLLLVNSTPPPSRGPIPLHPRENNMQSTKILSFSSSLPLHLPPFSISWWVLVHGHALYSFWAMWIVKIEFAFARWPRPNCCCWNELLQ